MPELFSRAEINAINCILEKVVYNTCKPYTEEEKKALAFLKNAKNNVANFKSHL
jgi:hypothetical protein